MSVLFAVLASALWGTADFLGGLAARRLSVVVVLGLSQLVALLGMTALATALGAFDSPRDYLVPAALAGLSGLVALVAFYRALAIGTMGVVAPLAGLGVVVPVVVGLLDGERPGLLQVVGIAGGVVGIVLASGPELSTGTDARPLVLAALAGVGFGAVLVLVARGSEDGSSGAVVMTLLTMRLVSVGLVTLFLVGVAVLSRSGVLATGLDAFAVSRRDLPVLAGVGLFDVGANGAFALASQTGLVSVTSVLASLYPVVTVLLARQVLAERLQRVQTTGVALALLGVVLIGAG